MLTEQTRRGCARFTAKSHPALLSTLTNISTATDAGALSTFAFVPSCTGAPARKVDDLSHWTLLMRVSKRSCEITIREEEVNE
jgi:hypothetical protein